MKRLLPILSLIFLTQFAIAQNNGLLFDGQDDALELCHSADFNIGAGFTIEAWIYANAWKPEAWQGSIVNKDQQGPDSGFAFRAGKNGTLSFVMAANNAWNEVQSDQIMNTNQWYHVAVVVEDATMTLYVSGAPVASAAYSGSPSSNTIALNIGGSPGFGGRHWDGFLDEVRIWNVARTASQINDNQTTEFNGFESGLVAYLPMNEGSGTTTDNLSGSGCDATFSNMDSDAWSDGYTVPDVDLGVISINAPDVLSIFRRSVKINVTVQNYGSEAVASFPLKLNINGLPSLEETFDVSIASGESKTVTFTTPLNLVDNNTNLVEALAAHPDDANPLNDAVSYRYKKPDDDRIVNILNEEAHNFGSDGQTQFTVVNLPENMEDFDQILLHFDVECPNGGCDPWDQPANFYVEPLDGSDPFEIARFVTPYGIECGPWTVDVTDFKSRMRGAVIFRSFIQVWGTSGWLVNADLEFISDDEVPSYQKTTTLWNTDYWVYGDPDVDDNLEAQTVDVNSATQTGHMRMTISGHGQGNTDNAAEFSNKTHTIEVDGSAVGNHNLWKDDCAQNPCANQAGTWTLSRAGWCPGQEVRPFIFNLTNEITPGSAVNVDYVLEDYTNLLNTGYNGSTHTEPHYRLHAYFVEQSDEWLTEYRNLRAENISVVTNGSSSDPEVTDIILEIKNTGSEAMSGASVAYFVNGELIAEESVSETIAAGATYTHSFSSTSGFTVGQDHEVFGVVTSSNDENLSDDVARTFVDGNLTSIDELVKQAFKVFPNPSAGQFSVQVDPLFLRGMATITDTQGRQLTQRVINDTQFDFELSTSGMFILTITTPEGESLYRKLVVHE